MIKTTITFFQKILYGFGFGMGMTFSYTNQDLFKLDKNNIDTIKEEFDDICL